MIRILFSLVGFGIGSLIGTLAAIIHIEIIERKRRENLKEIKKYIEKINQDRR